MPRPSDADCEFHRRRAEMEMEKALAAEAEHMAKILDRCMPAAAVSYAQEFYIDPCNALC